MAVGAFPSKTEKFPKNFSSEKSTLGKDASIASTPQKLDPRKRLFKLQDAAAKLLPHSKVSQCCRVPVPGADAQIARREDRAYYRNLIVCSRVWECPVCSVRIGQQRREELSQALIKARQRNLTPVLLSLTLQHHIDDSCKDNIAALQKAYRWAFSGRYMAWLREEFMWVGNIRNLEVTLGVNGWHTHTHSLVFLDLSGLTSTPETVAQHLQSKLAKRWQKALRKFGYNASLERGCDVRTADEDIAEYIAKHGREPEGWWGAADEVGRTPSKKAAKDGLTPMQLLEAYLQTNAIDFALQYGGLLKDRKQAGARFREYAQAFHGRHQLQYSRGLRELLGLDQEVPDEELPIEPEEIEPPETIMNVPAQAWHYVVNQALRFELLEVAAGGRPAVIAWFAARGLFITTVDLSLY